MQRLSRVYELTRRMARALTVEDLLKVLHEGLRREFPFRRLRLVLADKVGEGLGSVLELGDSESWGAGDWALTREILELYLPEAYRF